MIIDYNELLHEQNTGIIRLRTSVYVNHVSSNIQQDVYFFPKTVINSSRELLNKFNDYLKDLDLHYEILNKNYFNTTFSKISAPKKIIKYKTPISGCSLNLKLTNLEKRLSDKNIFFVKSKIPELYGFKYSLYLDNIDKHVSNYFQNNPSEKRAFLADKSQNKTVPALSILEKMTFSLL